jgi:DNA helicase-2/ATP-dependent DNA helicase PcrA
MSNHKILDGVDKEIYQYLDLNSPKSFLLFAGAGSGKTRTLVNVLQEIRNRDLPHFIKNGQRVAVITYTNAACQEIQHRLKYDPIFAVSTIHSFTWELIKPFTEDIKAWLRDKLNTDIAKLDAKLATARSLTNKTAIKNTRSRDSKVKRRKELEVITSFTYSPTSMGQGKGSLNHGEVIQLGAEFIANQVLMQNVLVNRFPILLIDESQDTNRQLLEAFMSTQQSHSEHFSLGLFGDLMQRIYSGGKEDLEISLPESWKTPAKEVNYRSPKRVIKLINAVRDADDGKQQNPKNNAEEGVVRLFIIDSNSNNKSEIELDIRARMVEFTSDEKWNQVNDVKTLTLEHAMAANRGEFSDFFIPLASEDSLRDSVLNGTSSTIKFITEQLLPLIEAVLADDDFDVARIIKKYSSIMVSNNSTFIQDPIGVLKEVNNSVKELKVLLQTVTVSLRQVVKLVGDKELLLLPENFKILLSADTDDDEIVDEEELDPKLLAWDKALNSSLKHVINYAKYISDELGFSTHQGVKGLEFERVMVILDDESSKGFLFKYEKLFGAVQLSKIDIENEAQGKDSVISRTRRLFYVTCSRAEKSLAIVAYSEDPLAVKKHAIVSTWFNDDEIVLLK